ncbi:hypothetical protein QAD02_008751 [Eretmocerus hayati]|uniref:Uncharacterized protein n=1 Tax=Eretmocerus hayati TaxID=131215 RepID=A0ACC2N7A8_9HYME|nr:hypothetical protein QAD02_008751 [Eretmocerus hayati]
MSEVSEAGASSMPTTTQVTIQPPVLQVASRMLRSPSHESVTTDLSLFSVSSIASDAKNQNRLSNFKSCTDVHLSGRGPSPNPDSRLQVHGNRPPDIPEMLWFEEETELIRSCGALSTALGLQKSFSTSDVWQLPDSNSNANNSISCWGRLGSLQNQTSSCLRPTVSAPDGLDLAHRGRLLLEQARLEHASRSCSTWVAVGDVASNSQLPSPHAGPCSLGQLQAGLGGSGSTAAAIGGGLSSPGLLPFTAADLVRSVNKRVRQSYIRRRLLTTYKALERLSQSEFNLDRLEAAASAALKTPGISLTVPGASLVTSNAGATLIPGLKPKCEHVLTVRDVERERGKQLSKYERNMMIFNWLHTLDDTTDEVSVQ